MSDGHVARLGDVCAVQNGFAFDGGRFSGTSGTPLIRIRDLKTNAPSLRFDGPFDPAYVVQKGDVLVGMDGEFVAYEWQGPASLLNQRVCRLIVQNSIVDAGFLRFAVGSHLKKIEDRTSKTTVKHISSRTIQEIHLPLPPLDEQRRIAGRLRDQLSATDALRFGVERRLETIAHVHSEVLASTFARIHASAVALGAAVSQPGAIADGPFGSHLKTEHYARSGVRVIRLQNIGSGKFLDHDRAFVTREHADTLTRHTALEGDVVVAALGDGARPAGRACQVPDIGPALVKADCFRVRAAGTPLDPEFLVWFLNSPGTQATLAAQMRGATRPRVTLAMLKAFTIPLPPIDEQRRIADSLREQLTEIDRAKAALETQRKAIVALPAALLREAFGPAPRAS